MRDGRQHAEGVGREEDDVLWMTRASAGDVIADVVERITRARVLRDLLALELDLLGKRIELTVLKHRPEHLCGGVDVRLALLGEVDHLRVAAAFKVEYPVARPAMFVVADEPALRVC